MISIRLIEVYTSLTGTEENNLVYKNIFITSHKHTKHMKTLYSGTVYTNNGVTFKAEGVVTADHRDAVIVTIQSCANVSRPFDFIVTANIIPHKDDKRYHLSNIRFERSHTLEQLTIIGGAISQFSNPVQKILKSIYETYINA